MGCREAFCKETLMKKEKLMKRGIKVILQTVFPDLMELFYGL